MRRQGFLPVIRRLTQWWGDYFAGGMRRGLVSCVGCGGTLSLETRCPSHRAKLLPVSSPHPLSAPLRLDSNGSMFCIESLTDTARLDVTLCRNGYRVVEMREHTNG